MDDWDEARKNRRGEEAAGSKRQTRATVTRFPVPTLRIA